MSTNNTKIIFGLTVNEEAQKWLAFKNRLDINIDNQLNHIDAEEIPLPMAYLTAEYVLQGLYEHRRALDDSTIEARAIGARYWDVLQFEGQEFQALGPDDLSKLSDRQARQYAITVMEEIRRAQEEKKTVDERIARKQAGKQTEQFESSTLFWNK